MYTSQEFYTRHLDSCLKTCMRLSSGNKTTLVKSCLVLQFFQCLTETNDKVLCMAKQYKGFMLQLLQTWHETKLQRNKVCHLLEVAPWHNVPADQIRCKFSYSFEWSNTAVTMSDLAKVSLTELPLDRQQSLWFRNPYPGNWNGLQLGSFQIQVESTLKHVWKSNSISLVRIFDLRIVLEECSGM